MTAPSNPLLSPTSTSSYDLVSSGSLSDRDVASDDEVVWLPHGSSESSYEGSPISNTDDDDFVVLSRSRSPLHGIIRTPSEGSSSSEGELSSAMSKLSFGGTSAPYRPAARRNMIESSSSTATLKVSTPNPLQPSPLGESFKKKTKTQKKAARKARKATRAEVANDAASDAGSTSTASTVSGYEDASNFITTFLLNPGSKDSVCKLTLLHSLIIELGLSGPSPSPLPGSLTAAKALLKSQAHINIKEYVAVREQGQDALRKVMHPSHSALVKDIRKRGNSASLRWVKSHGLQVLLVHCFY